MALRFPLRSSHTVSDRSYGRDEYLETRSLVSCASAEPISRLVGVQKTLKQPAEGRRFLNRNSPVGCGARQAGQRRRDIRRGANVRKSFNFNETATTARGDALEDIFRDLQRAVAALSASN